MKGRKEEEICMDLEVLEDFTEALSSSSSLCQQSFAPPACVLPQIVHSSRGAAVFLSLSPPRLSFIHSPSHARVRTSRPDSRWPSRRSRATVASLPRGFGVGDADAPGPPRCACAPERPARADAIADDIDDIACGALIPAMRGPYASVESRWPARPSVKKAAMRRHLGAARRRIAEGL